MDYTRTEMLTDFKKVAQTIKSVEDSFNDKKVNITAPILSEQLKSAHKYVQNFENKHYSYLRFSYRVDELIREINRVAKLVGVENEYPVW